MDSRAQDLKDINSCASVAAYTLRALADAMEACQANGGSLACCGPQPKADQSA